MKDIEKKKKKAKKQEIVSAYDEEGNPKKEYQNKGLSKGYKVFLFFVYAFGLLLGLGVILLLERCQG
ncbi:MAG: hypothetical protein WCZ47_03265 [Bacilli bacterium]|jgi:hypothetical protein|nr:hypothetical protein [Bacilli bacterium]